MLQTGGQWGALFICAASFSALLAETIVGTAVDALTQSKFFPLNNWQNQATEMASSTRPAFCSMLFDH